MPAPARLRDKTDQELTAALQQGQTESLSLLYDRYSPVLLGLLTRMVPNPKLAESLLQQTFVQIWFKKDSYDPSRLSLLSWVILMARDTAKSALETPRKKDFSNPAESVNFTNSETGNLTAALEEPGVKELCCRLEPPEKAALDLVYLKGYSCDGAATQLGISVEELRKTLKMAIKHLGAEKTA